MKYVGLVTLELIAAVNAKYVVNQQLAVVDCLKSNDDSLKRKTLELLYKIANAGNVDTVVSKIVEYLQDGDPEAHVKDVSNSRITSVTTATITTTHCLS